MSMMKECTSQCKWCPVVCVIIGILLFFVGYTVEPEVLQIIWLIMTGLMAICGVVMLVAFRIIGRS